MIRLANAAVLGALTACTITASTGALAQNTYRQTNLIASSGVYAAQITDPTLVNAWGIALRPAGLGGHFWIAANTTGISSQWVGDVGGVPLYQDELRFVSIPGPVTGAGVTPAQPRVAIGTATGVAFNGGTGFSVTQGSISAPAKFIFATDNGVISGWTERQVAPGVFDRPHNAVAMIDRSAQGAQFFGLGVDSVGGRLYAANFGLDPGMQMFDASWTETTASFANTALGLNPFAAAGYQPFNTQVLGNSVFVAYAKYGTPGEEETGDALGRVAQFSLDGALQHFWGNGNGLNAPWGMAMAPSSFGALSGHLLVSNFGDGSIAAFDPATHAFVDYMRHPNGDRVEIEGIWGLQFGNGESLGTANHLYFAAGPADETAGLFGSLAPVPEPSAAVMMLAGMAWFATLAHWRRRSTSAK